MTIMFDSPLKKLTESETVIAALVVEDILAGNGFGTHDIY